MTERERERQMLVLAYGIALWSSTQRSLNALRAVGERVPYSTMATVAIELNDMVLRWPTAQFEGMVETRDVMTARVDDEVRRYLAEHGDELERLLNESEMTGEHGRRQGEPGGPVRRTPGQDPL